MKKLLAIYVPESVIMVCSRSSARQGVALHGWARRCAARHCWAWPGLAGHGIAGPGVARHGPARHGKGGGRWIALAPIVVWLLSCAFAHAQVVPAQLGTTPTLTPNTLSVLDPSKVWVPLGYLNPTHTFTPVGGGGGSSTQGLTSVLVNRTTSPVWSASFTSGGTCAPSTGGASVFCGGTEGRGFAVKNALTPSAQLFFINGYWEDTPGPEGQQNAQILVLNGPEAEGNAWQQDLNFGALCPSDNPICALAGSAIVNANWTRDTAGNTGLNVQTIVASIWWEGSSSSTNPVCASTPVYIVAKNNTPGDTGGLNFSQVASGTPYYGTQIACETNVAGEGTPQVRSFSQPHIDLATTIPAAPPPHTLYNPQYMFVGEGPTGVFQCQLNNNRAANNNPLQCLTGASNAEWNSSNYSGPPCGTPSSPAQIRVMGFAEIKGSDNVLREYMSGCFAVYVRIDGPQTQTTPTVLSCNPDQVIVGGACQQRWQLYWSDPQPGTSRSGNRGLTATADGVLLLGAEGSGAQNFYSIPPYPACNGTVTTLTTNAATAAGLSTLSLSSSVPSGVAVGWLITDITTPSAISNNTTVASIAGSSVTMSQSVPAGQTIGNTDQIRFQPPTATLATSAPTAAGSTALTFSSVSGVAAGWFITDITNPSAIPNNTTIASFTSSTVTMSVAVQTGQTVATSDQIRFQSPPCSATEYGVFANSDQALGMTIGNTVAPYNSFPSYIDEVGNQHYLAPQSSYITAGIPTGSPIPPGPYTLLYMLGGTGGRKLAEAVYTFRNSPPASSGVPGPYNFAYIPQLFPTAMNGTRDMIASPFLHDCGYFGASNVRNCGLYATGFDSDNRTAMYWCKANPCPTLPLNPSLATPLHNTSWVAKLWYPGIAPY